jgi:hypothetical protein
LQVARLADLVFVGARPARRASASLAAAGRGMQKSGSGTSIGVDSDRESVVAGSDGDYAAAMENVSHGGLERRVHRAGSRES